jgi:ferredoxin
VRLGKTAANPVLSTLRYFRSEYEKHIVDKVCPAGVCKKITTFEILLDKCPGCGLCVKACPVEGITGEKKQPHTINPDKCTRCGACFDTCNLGAIIVKSRMVETEVVA